jgi:hypothetical protein
MCCLPLRFGEKRGTRIRGVRVDLVWEKLGSVALWRMGLGVRTWVNDMVGCLYGLRYCEIRTGPSWAGRQRDGRLRNGV